MTNHLPEDQVDGRGRERWRRIAEAVVLVVAMAAPARAQDRNDMNDPPPLPRPTPEQRVGLRRLDRLARYLMDTPGGTPERFLRRELRLPRATPVDLAMMACYFALSEDEALQMLGGPDPAGTVRRHLHWWDRYGEWSARGGTP